MRWKWCACGPAMDTNAICRRLIELIIKMHDDVRAIMHYKSSHMTTMLPDKHWYHLASLVGSIAPKCFDLAPHSVSHCRCSEQLENAIKCDSTRGLKMNVWSHSVYIPWLNSIIFMFSISIPSGQRSMCSFICHSYWYFIRIFRFDFVPMSSFCLATHHPQTK